GASARSPGRPRAKSPKDPSIATQLGLVYSAHQQYARAEPLLEEAYRANPELDSLGYYVGFLRYRKKDYRGALAAFRDGRSSDPEIQQLTRFYTGLALGVLGLPGQAAAEVEQAIRLAPPAAAAGSGRGAPAPHRALKGRGRAVRRAGASRTPTT